MKFTRLAVLALALIAACSDSPTSPATPPTNVLPTGSVALMSISSDTVRYGPTYMVFGNQPTDSSSDFFGQQPVGGDYPAQPVLLHSGETAILAAAPSGAGGLISGDSVGASIQFLSDWKPVEPEKHPGVTFDKTAMILFRIEQYGTLPNGQIGGPSSWIYQTQVVRVVPDQGLKATVNIGLHTSSVLSFVLPMQIYHIGCAGNDSLTFRATVGMSEVISDQYNKNWVGGSQAVRERTIHCSIYSSESAALNRIAGR